MIKYNRHILPLKFDLKLLYYVGSILQLKSGKTLLSNNINLITKTCHITRLYLTPLFNSYLTATIVGIIFSSNSHCCLAAH